MLRRSWAVVLIAFALAVLVPLAALRATPSARGQIVPPGSPPTTPQPTVPCTPPGPPNSNPGGAGCGRGPGVRRDVAWAFIVRFCNGSAVPTPPGQTTFALTYGLGGLSAGPVQFSGILTVNGQGIPTTPLLELQPGERDVRIRTATVPSDATFTVTLTGFYTAGPLVGEPVQFGNGSGTRIRTASGACPGAPTVVSVPPAPAPPAPVPTPAGPVPGPTPAPGTPVKTVPPGTFPPAL